jgi:hypothetical protein
MDFFSLPPGPAETRTSTTMEGIAPGPEKK